MRSRVAFVAFALVGVLMPAAGWAQVVPPGLSPGQAVPGRFIVTLQPGGDPGAVAAAHGAQPANLYRHALRGFAAHLSPAQLAGLRGDPRVWAIEPDVVDSAFCHTDLFQILPTGINRIDADLNTTANIDGVDDLLDVDIAIIDTGIDLDNPDLAVVSGVDCRRVDKQGNCKKGGDRGDDDHGHGTHCAGIAAAIDNDRRVVGVAPGARLHAVKVLDRNGSGFRSWVIQGIDHVTKNADVIDVANMSLGGSGWDDTDGADCAGSGDAEHIAICNATNAGVVFVVAAGNSRDDAAFHVPAAYDEVITVSALADFDGVPDGLNSGPTCRTDEDDSFANFSNFGHDVDLIAPGVCIYSTWPDGFCAEISGTSMASPHVAGAAALEILASGKPGDLAGVLAVRDALVAAGDPAPCATPTGVCWDDPDGVQEPMVYVETAGCSADPDCDDGNACNGAETCDLATGLCVAGVPLDCDDGDACTNDSCDPGTGFCAHDLTSCDDGNLCTDDSCDSVLGCVQVNNANPCDDGDACTLNDTCSGGFCSGDPACSCLSKGAGCSDDAECCSTKCKGKLGARTCK